MNFSPPQGWLQARPGAASETLEASEPTAVSGAPGGRQRVRGVVRVTVAEAPSGPPRLPAGVHVGMALPTAPVQLRLRPSAGEAQPVTFCVADFTREAMAMAHLRYAACARRGWLLEHERAPADMLDAHDPTALHVVALCGGELVACMRVLLPPSHARQAWQQLVGGPRAEELATLAPTGEFSRLAVQDGHLHGGLVRSLVQAATYVLLASGRRYAFVAAAPGHAALWPRFGFARTGLGGYVPCARPHVVEVYLADMLANFAGSRTSLRTWHRLFSASHGAVARALDEEAQLAPTWPQALYRSLSRVITKFKKKPPAG